VASSVLVAHLFFLAVERPTIALARHAGALTDHAVGRADDTADR
jgi:hypothetical protein